MNRRQFNKSLLGGAALLATSSLGYAGVKFWPETGLSNPCLTGLPEALRNHPLMTQIWEGIDAQQVWDSHVHIVGVGDAEIADEQKRVWFNPNMESYWHPILKVQKNFYMNGGCVNAERVDDSYVERLIQISKEMPIGYKSMLFAFDWYHDAQGRPDKTHSIFHVPDQYVADIASKNPQHFEWVASIHPYRQDCIDALEKAHALGARAIKWLPSGMGIDPASAKCDRFYQKLHDLDLPIISHTGRESAVQGGDQAHGNPLRMRRALDNGVRVLLAHCASDGHDEDLDHNNRSIKSFELFTRLMDTPSYEKLVFGEISALTLINHAWAIKPILARQDWQHRVINGSDYPLPGIVPLISTKALALRGLLKDEHLLFLQNLRHYNPLMFDFATKRLMSFEGNSFNKFVFETRSFFEKAKA
jgi:predicted TIM-barrel fold metal-dependent hydrolase